MDKKIEELIPFFMENYLPRREVLYRLPVSLPIQTFWPRLMAERKAKAITLPLHSDQGAPYWYVPTKELLAYGDRVATMARSQQAAQLPQYQEMLVEGLMDEAYFSSVIEGASTQRQHAKAFLKSGAPPRDKDEQMIFNNYQALNYALNHLDEPITHDTILEIARILTRGTLEEELQGYRTQGVQVVSGRQEVVYVAPEATHLLPMMEELLHFIKEDSIHPVLKACIAHVYFVTVHPLIDGNGRTARALTYMILLRSGYDFFRHFPISSLIAAERPRYYKALQDVQSKDGGGDMTYFLLYYTSLLSRSVDMLNDSVFRLEQIQTITNRLSALGNVPERIMEGAKWLLKSDAATITSDKWRKKWGVSFETARQDLQVLEANGLLSKRVEGRKHIFDIIK